LKKDDEKSLRSLMHSSGDSDGDVTDNASDDDVRYRSLDEEQHVELTDVVHQDHDRQGYSKDKEKSFNPVSQEKETEAAVEELKDHKQAKDKKRASPKPSLFKRFFEKMLHLATISDILDKETDKKRRPHKYNEEEVRKMAAYKQYVEQRPGDQAGMFDKKEVAAEKGQDGKKTLSTFFTLDPSMDGMSMSKPIGLTMNDGPDVLSLDQGMETSRSQGEGKNQQKLRERDLEVERGTISRGQGPSR
jgi:hypothetical protein